MKTMKHLVSLTIFLLLIGAASQSFGAISDAALLYLRIAPGSRAAGMGEAYVAIADDATATHWNPAGLGTSPLATNWRNISIPAKLQPVKQFTAVKARGGGGYDAYDIWAITAQGLTRYDNHNWNMSDEFATHTDQTVSDIVRRYFNLTEESGLTDAVNRVVAENSRYPLDSLNQFKSELLANVPESYSDLAGLTNGLDSLIAMYELCRINWDQYDDARKLYRDGIKDESLTEKEIDRINFAIERSKNRFIPEILKITYSNIFSGDLTCIGSMEDLLVVGTTDGLFTFNGKSWRAYGLDDGLPSKNVRAITTIGRTVYVGTDKGLVQFNGRAIVGGQMAEAPKEDSTGMSAKAGIVGEVVNSGDEFVKLSGNLPVGDVSAIGGLNASDVWAVIDNMLYHFDGQNWSNSFSYKTSIDDSFESLAKKFAIYGTPSEKAKIIETIKKLNTGQPKMNETSGTVDDSTGTVKEAFVLSEDSTGVVLDTAQVAENTETAEEPSEVTGETAMEEAAPDSLTETTETTELVIEPGMTIQVPYTVGLKGKVNVVHATNKNQLWLGTQYGLLSFKQDNSGASWNMTGYKEVVVADGQTFDDIIAANPHGIYDSDKYGVLVKDLNELESTDLTTGQVLKVYSNPTAYPVNDLMDHNSSLYVATRRGIFSLHNSSLDKVNSGGMEYANVIDLDSRGSEIWYASSNKMSIKANGQNDIAIMFAKWLPQLADDIYYGFMSGVTNINGLGTVGLSFTYINYGTVVRTDVNGVEIGTFEPFDIAIGGSYGTSITEKLKAGLTLKFIYSHLSRIGAGVEVGSGTSTGLALDFGTLYHITPKYNFGMAITNIGPDISYIDAAQSDPLPRNLAVGFSGKVLSSEYYHLLCTVEMNKSIVNDVFTHMGEAIYNGGAEFQYANVFAVRGGYIYDKEGDVKTVTVGVGLTPISNADFDFAYIPSGTTAPLANTLRISFRYSW